MHERDSTEQHS